MTKYILHSPTEILFVSDNIEDAIHEGTFNFPTASAIVESKEGLIPDSADDCYSLQCKAVVERNVVLL